MIVGIGERDGTVDVIAAGHEAEHDGRETRPHANTGDFDIQVHRIG